ncbi:MAG: hypothetical protein A3D65_04900 [Candidatus Lloydbacteria bacterium RIFCSPHIGHO2_02_FULL_50_13]|uniref:Nucleotidyl transferase AbiEii/AbiGii toxin family protein n=1 Tax=Candidatus Lloydbacteria bacterium RIFCSPHIGHO2_02_FULL_50_13 TaxID=1798661 RepID=A0A1G2D4K0_9BACT|nr:MAG: hypothetical protein A3D65_04900 [Candidatus Lloydbacteria bacterium RIFCSPHIGHO2_02_FULL_50_13]
MVHLEALTDKGREIFPRLSYFSDFYLAGGTALSLQIGHRVSVDFDFFHDEKIKRTLLPSVEKIFDDYERRVLVNNANELTILADEVKITFLSYPFPVILPKTDIDKVAALAVSEIGATKAYTIGRRGMFKNYVDVYAVLHGGHATLVELIAHAEKKYGSAFNARLFLEQLAYFDDLEETPIVFLGKGVRMTEIIAFFSAEIKKLEI